MSARHHRFIAIVVGLLLLSGCIVIPYEPGAHTTHSLDAVENPERIRLTVGPRTFLEEMAKAARKQDKRLELLDGQTFVDTASPAQELTLARLLDPATQALIEPLAADYLVVFGEPQDATLETHGGGVFMMGYYGLQKAKTSTTFWTAIIDLRQLRVLEQVTAESVGTDVGAGLFYGLFIVSDTRDSAKKDVIRDVVLSMTQAKPDGPVRVVFLANEPIPDPPTAELVAKAEAKHRAQQQRDLSFESYPAFEAATPPAEGQGLIYLYRPGDVLGSFSSVAIHAGPKEAEAVITKLWSGGYHPFYAPSGDVTLWLDTEEAQVVTLPVVAGETYYVKMTMHMGWKAPKPGLTLVDGGDAKHELAKCRLIPTARDADFDVQALAGRGYRWAQVELGSLYATGVRYVDGTSLPQDDIESYKWYSVAATTVHAPSATTSFDLPHTYLVDLAAQLRSTQAASMNAAQIAEGERRARLWLDAYVNDLLQQASTITRNQ